MRYILVVLVCMRVLVANVSGYSRVLKDLLMYARPRLLFTLGRSPHAQRACLHKPHETQPDKMSPHLNMIDLRLS